MKIYPAIDLMDGHCVRLVEGRFDSRADYSNDPLAVTKSYEAAGARYLHVVDLDGAKRGESVQLDLIASLVRSTSLKVQVGGGLRNESDIQRLFDSGADRVVIGSVAFKDPAHFSQIVKRFGPDRITLAVDFQMIDGEAKILTHGWQNETSHTVEDSIRHLRELGLRRFLCTDVSKDGKLAGTNSAFYAELQRSFSDIEIFASGGVSSLEDLSTLQKQNIFGVIIGKALYEKRFTIAEALRFSEKESILC